MAFGQRPGIELGRSLDGRIDAAGDREVLADLPFRFAGQADKVGERVLVRLLQSGQRSAKFDRINVLALPVLGNLMQQHTILAWLAHQTWYFGQSCQARSSKATFSRNDNVHFLGGIVAHRDRLQDSNFLDGTRKFVNCFLADRPPNLSRIGTDAIAGN